MKLTLLTIVGVCGTLNARLIEKNTDRTVTETKTKIPQLPPRVRLTRDVFEDDTFAGFSKEDNGQSIELVQFNRKARDYFAPDPVQYSNHYKTVIRKTRESNEKVETPKNSSVPHSVKTKIVLVKKPIPKYHEIDYDDDFQMKVSGSSVKVADSGEHEDEDFNVGDYDFDINHDEFVGRGKPLEPRVKHKELIGHRNRARPKPVLKVYVPEIKIPSKLLVPIVPVTTLKKERALPPKTSHEKNKEVDYYDDTTTTTVKSTEKDKKDSDDEDEADDTREVISKVQTRQARSPWKNSYVDKLGEKSSNIFASKLLSILPMFPSLQRKQMDYIRASEDPMYD